MSRIDTESPGVHLHASCSGTFREFAFWIANGTVGFPLLKGLDYWSAMRESPSLMEQVFAIFVNSLIVDGQGVPLNRKSAERRSAQYILQYMTGAPAVPAFEDWEVALHQPPAMEQSLP